MNTRSTKYIYEILRILKEGIIKPNELKVEWIYEKDDINILESAIDIEHVVSIDIDFIQC